MTEAFGINMKRIVCWMVMLVVSTTLTARQKPTTLDKQQPEDKEQVLFQRVFDAQMNGSDSDFYQAHEAFMNYLESRQDWEKYYRAWLNRVIYDVNHKYFHRAFTEINYITDDIKDRHQEQYLYTTHLGMGLFFNGRNQPEEGEKYFRRALQGIDAEKEPAAVFNSYLSLAQSLSFTRPAEAMACLDSLPGQMLQNPMYESGVLGYRCIIANTLGDRTAFNRYFSRYDSIRQNLPDQFNAANLHQVMVCRCLMQNDYRQALAWCDSIDVPLTATELRIDVYEQMGDWKQAFRASEIRDSLRRLDEREALEIHTKDMEHDIDLLQAEQEKAKIRHIQLVIVGLMALAIIGLLRSETEAGQAIRRAFVNTIYNKLKSPINVLRGYARIFSDPNFLLKPEERPKRYSDIISAARSIESMMDPVLDSYVRGTASITEEEKRICMDALRSPLLTLINTSEVIIEGHGDIPHDEYMQLRDCVCRDAYHVAISTHQLILFSLYGDDAPIPKTDRIKLNEGAQTVLNTWDLHPSAIDKGRHLPTEFSTEVADDVEVNTNPLLQDLLNCLLDNADKYAAGGAVRMSCHACPDGTYAIAVSNEGPSVAAEDAERIFEPFVRLYPEEHSLGIGLPLARRLANSMGYEVTLDLDYTKGTRLVVSGI